MKSTNNDNLDFIDLKGLSKKLSLSPRTLRGWVTDSVSPLPTYRLGGKLLFNWKEVQRWIENFKIKPIGVHEIISDIFLTKGKSNG